MELAKEARKFKDIIRSKFEVTYISNFIFQLHYCYTFLGLVVFIVIVCSRQYIGEHIHCIADKGVETRVIETFCFFTSTFTVVRHLGNISRDLVPHPGVGPHIDGEPIVRHAYYQWVPYVLAFQAVLFLLPHVLWEQLEGGRVKAMAEGLKGLILSSGDKETRINGEISVPSRAERGMKVNEVSDAFLDRLRVNRWWARQLVLCELLNLINVIFQVWLMERFLGGGFMGLGELLLGVEPSPERSLDAIFPKVTKCTFHKFGPSGSLQRHDALCIMALNVVNEKIYTILWYWFLTLFALSALVLVYRALSTLLYSRSTAYNRYVFAWSCPAILNQTTLRTITKACTFSDWVFLYYLTKSLDGFLVKELLDRVAYEMNKKEMIMKLDNDNESSFLKVD